MLIFFRQLQLSPMMPIKFVNTSTLQTIQQHLSNKQEQLYTISQHPSWLHSIVATRGPNVLDPNILKPDITAPSCLEDGQSVDYNIDSGTSMACPHVAAAVALLKAVHSDWSSAAIRSALMTKAWMRKKGLPITEANGNLGTPFSYGWAHFHPIKAVDPGLVYNASYNDYLLYHLCSTGQKDAHSSVQKCQLQLPISITQSLAIPKLNGTVIVKRTIINVGCSSKSVYFFTAKPPLGVSVKASPSLLFFNRVAQKKSFTITVRARREMVRKQQKNEYRFGWYTWTDGHYVKSPIAVSLAYVFRFVFPVYLS